MLIDRVYQTLKMLANTDIRGNVSPQEYNLALVNVIMEKYEEYFFGLTRAVNRERRGLANFGLENVPDRLREKLQFFLKTGTQTITSGACPLPADCRYIDSVFTASNRQIEIMENASEFNHLLQFDMLIPTAQYPVALRTGSSLMVRPVFTNGTVLTYYYLREPKLPKWTYVVVDGAEIFNPSALDFQDIDMHTSEEDDIVQRLLVKFGINLKEPDLQASSNNAEQQDNNEQAPI